MKKILLHVCCGPCSISPILKLQEAGFEVLAYFYNPNIHPLKEYLKRREAMQQVAEQLGVAMLWDDDYNLKAWLATALNTANIQERCEFCYTSRLQRCFELARAKGFDYFSSSLLYSVRQNHDLIIAVAKNIASSAFSAGEDKCNFFYQDFRVDWQKGIDISKELGIYRQNYCGCIFSENERFFKEYTKVITKNI